MISAWDCYYSVSVDSGGDGPFQLTAEYADGGVLFSGNVDGACEFKSPESGLVNITVKNNSEGFAAADVSYRLDRSRIPDTWTIMLYFNSTNLEDTLMENVKEIVDGYHPDIGINVVLLIDKMTQNWSYDIPGFDFDDTRLYLIRTGNPLRLSGGMEFSEISAEAEIELNMGDAVNLRKFIEYGKANFPAQRYAFIIHSHGEGVSGLCGDNDSAGGDRLHIGEISSELNSSHSVDLIGFNCCLMGNAETAYQIRNGDGNDGFCAEIMVASAGKSMTKGWKYDTAFGRINRVSGGDGTSNLQHNSETDEISGGSELVYNPAEMSAVELASVIIEENRDGIYEYLDHRFYIYDNLTAYRLDMAGEVKAAADALAEALAENNEKSAMENLRNECGGYFYIYIDDEESTKEQQAEYPLYELRDLSEGITAAQQNVFNPGTVAAADAVTAAADNMLLYSYYFGDLSGDYGLSIFFSLGDLIYNEKPMFEHQYWYNPATLIPGPGSSSEEQYYGNLY